MVFIVWIAIRRYVIITTAVTFLQDAIVYKRRMITLLATWGLLLPASCGRRNEAPRTRLNVAAPANLTFVLDDIAADFRKQSGIKVVLSYGSTAQLAQQIAGLRGVLSHVLMGSAGNPFASFAG